MNVRIDTSGGAQQFQGIECELAHPAENVFTTVSTIITKHVKLVGCKRDAVTTVKLLARQDHTLKFKFDCQIAPAVRG